MEILCIGDVCGPAGCEALKRHLPHLKKQYNADLTIVNGENGADGNGITPHTAEIIFNYGADIITGGNHSLKREEIKSALENNPCLLRPHNLPDCDFGSGYTLFDMGKYRVAVINLLGTAYLEKQKAENPFTAANVLIEKAKSDGANAVIVDFHAEATGEKRAFGFFVDGRVSAVFGTHTHVQTADAQILPLGTGYITDVGMVGAKDSVLGVKKEIIIKRMSEKNMQKFEFATGECIICGCVFSVNTATGKTEKVQSFCVNG